jgi:hypothetical protein
MKRNNATQISVSVGITTVIGVLTAIGGAIPIVVKLLEEGAKGLTLAGPEKWAAIISVVALGITQLGRYFQAVAIARNTPNPMSAVSEAARADGSPPAAVTRGTSPTAQRV